VTQAESISDAELAERPFDELVAELQRIVAALEAGSVGLEESIALYREGLRIHAACEERLRTAELTISELGRRAGATAPAAGAADPAPADPGDG
jgi:exodeoxyribonuclease VII small subunit